MRGLHVGCGARVEDGWTNIDLEPSAAGVQRVDVTKGLPFDSDSFDFVYTEHFLEHLTRVDAERFLNDAWRVLKPGGAIRISTPDMEALAELYLAALKWRDPKKWGSGELMAKNKNVDAGNDAAWPDPMRFYAPVGWVPNDPCDLVNGGMRLWGHLHLWDYPALSNTLLALGFDLVGRAKHGRTRYPGMLLEGRPDLRDLIVEGQKLDTSSAR